MRTIIFDIETGPLPVAELYAMLPPFDPGEVKCGNIKDPAKIADKVAEAEANHTANFIARAALDPLTGRVVAIGCRVYDLRKPLTVEEVTIIIGRDNEADTLREFWELAQDPSDRVAALIGFNICLFDLPFLFRRSWKQRIPIPLGYRRGRYWGDYVIDLRDVWQLGDRMAKGSLGVIAKHLGVGEKSGDGKDFAALWVHDRPQAEAYLRNDLQLTVNVAAALGVVA